MLLSSCREHACVPQATTNGYINAVIPAGMGDLDSLAPGEGAVVQKGLQKVAAYVDEKVCLTVLSSNLECSLRLQP
jgi:hypothetical protein